MKSNVEKAIEEIARHFPGHRLESSPDGEGGAFIKVHDLPVGEDRNLPTSWIGFRVTFQYPNADIYPHFLRPDLRRRDGAELGSPCSAGQFNGEAAIQVSRKSHRWNASMDTAATKLALVLKWLEAL